MPSLILTERENNIVTVKFNNPGKLNIMNEKMGEEFFAVCSELSRDKDLRAVILTGEGRAFCAGGDLDWLLSKSQKTMDENRLEMLAFYKMFLKVREIEAPVIAAINGPAIGAGMAVTLACDIRLCAESAKMGVTFVRLGINPGMGCTWFLPRLVGLQRALLLTLTGRVIDAEEAFRMGLVEGVYEDAVFWDEVKKLAWEIASASPLAVRWAKRTVWRGIINSLSDHLYDEAQGQAECYGTEDFKEGITATKEKRAPKFRGK